MIPQEKLIDKINEIILWINDHEKLTLDRFDKELEELINKPDSRTYKAIKDLVMHQMWCKDQYDENIKEMKKFMLPVIESSEDELEARERIND